LSTELCIGFGIDALGSPNGGYTTTNTPFIFRVSGGTGLPFNYTLLIDGEAVKSTCDGSDNNTLEVGEDFATDFSVYAKVANGEDKTWTVNVTDCAGNSYEPDPYHFSLDTTVPVRVANLSATDSIGETQWSYTHDSPRLYVSWDANKEGDLASAPYDVFVSNFEPRSINEMDKVKSTSDTNIYIEKYCGKPLVYGKDYWVAVIAKDKAGNYNNCFVAICGPVQTYEDTNITLKPGWNMKSVPKRLLESNSSPESVFGNESTVLYWNGTGWESPKTIDPCKGYWVYSPVALENNIKFKPISLDNSASDVPASINLTPGWQMIGIASTQPTTWSTTLASLKNSLNDYQFSNLMTYSSYEGWSGLVPELGVTTITNKNGSVISNGDFINGSNSQPVEALKYQGIMVPGQGYWIYMKEEGTYSPIESVNNNQNSSESFGTDVPIDNSLDIANTDNESTDVPIDNSLDVANADNGSTDVPIDNSLDVANADNGSTDVPIDNSLDVANTDNESTDVPIDNSLDVANADNGSTDVPIDNSLDVANADNGSTDVLPTNS
jgi:hypothetical protein